MSNDLALIDSLFFPGGNDKKYYPFDVVFHPTKGIGVVTGVDIGIDVYYFNTESYSGPYVGTAIYSDRPREEVKRIGNIIELLVMKMEGDDVSNISTSLLMDLIERLKFIPEGRRKRLRERFIWERDKQVHPHKYDCQGNMIEDKKKEIIDVESEIS